MYVGQPKGGKVQGKPGSLSHHNGFGLCTHTYTYTCSLQRLPRQLLAPCAKDESAQSVQ